MELIEGTVLTARKVGRPSKYDPDNYPRMAYEHALLGSTDESLARLFDVDVDTIRVWKNTKPEFSGALKEGTEIADSNVAVSLYKRAIGYEHKEDKIFQHNGEIIIQPTIKHYPPDTGAAKLWLSNRQGDKWREQKFVEENITEIKNIKISVDAPMHLLENLSKLQEKEALEVLDDDKETAGDS